MIGNEDSSRALVTSYILLVSGALVLAGGLFLPWYSIELDVFERATGMVGAAYRVPTIGLGALTLVLGLLMRTEVGPRLWGLPMALTVAGAAFAIVIFDVTVVMSHLDHVSFELEGPLTRKRIGVGVWVVLIGATMQFGLGMLSWGLERLPRAKRAARA